MSIFNSTQIAGEIKTVDVRSDGDGVYVTERTWVTVESSNSRVTMEACHVRALAAALDAYEARRGVRVEAM